MDSRLVAITSKPREVLIELCAVDDAELRDRNDVEDLVEDGDGVAGLRILERNRFPGARDVLHPDLAPVAGGSSTCRSTENRA